MVKFDTIDEYVKYLEENGLVVSALNDKIFKSLFQDRDMRNILAFIISTVTKMNQDYLLKNMRFDNTQIPNNNVIEKANTTDLLIDVSKKAISLEMNQFNDERTQHRNTAHFHALVVNNIKVNSKVKDTKEVIQINFDNEKPCSDELIDEYMCLNTRTYTIDEAEKNYRKYHINLVKVKNKYYNKEKLTRFERILLILTLEKKSELREIAKGDEEMEKMVSRIERLSKLQANTYDEEALEQQGINIAKANAEKRGIQKGIEQRNLDVAKNMLKEKMDLSMISKVTGLSKNVIKTITF